VYVYVVELSLCMFCTWLCCVRVPAVVFNVCACVAAALCIELCVLCVFCWVAVSVCVSLLGFVCVCVQLGVGGGCILVCVLS